MWGEKINNALQRSSNLCRIHHLHYQVRLITQIAITGGVIWDHPLIGGSHNYRGGRFVMEVVEWEVEKRRVIIAVVILVVVEVLLPVLVVLEVVTTI